jgi:glycosyltransferase involved in cell wall biosynthesis
MRGHRVRIALDCRYVQDHFPGIGRYTYELARHLPTLAPESEFLLLTDQEAVNTRFALDVALDRGNVREVRVPASPFVPRQQWTVRRAVAREAADLYHSPYYLMPYALPCRTVATIHDLIPARFPESLPRPRLAPLFNLLIRLCAWRADHLIVDSDATRDDLVHDRIGAPERMTRVHLGVDSRFRPQPVDEVSRYGQRAGLARPYLLYLGINKPHKNLAALLRAWALLPEPLRQEHMLVLAGPQDPRYTKDRVLIELLGIVESVRWIGRVPEEELPLLYAGATGLVFPSLYEGFGLPILEAMACGVPVACSDASSMPEIAGDAALLFDPANVHAMAAALGQLLSDATLRAGLTDRGLARAQAFTWERAAAETLQVYRRVLATTT